MRWLGYVLIGLIVFALYFISRGGGDLPAGEVESTPTPAAVLAARRDAQARAVGAVGADAQRQILFGDLHVHTTFSIDAFIYALPIFASEGAHPPADACDYARHCAALDFFSLNDHAEGLTPERWRSSIETLRACDARAGDPDDPDLVPFLGWEWTQVGLTPETHYGHKNVILRGLDDEQITSRPIAYRPGSDDERAPAAWQLRLGESAASFIGPDYANFMWWLGRLLRMPACEKGVPSPELPPDCMESADTPRELFDKLDQWGLPSIVIPHGLAWGIHAPPGARLDHQLTRRMHDPERQTLLEVFSGHGNSEEWRAPLDRRDAGDPAEVCPAPMPDHLACCWRAGEIMRERCGDLPEAECEARVAEARTRALAAGTAPHRVFPDTSAEDWLDCDDCRDCFKPAATLRAGQTAQYSLAITHFDEREPLRFRWGFIASSDNHRARAATGFKQFARNRTTDSRGLRDPELGAWIERLGPEADPLRALAIEPNPRSFDALFDKERQASFMYPGGLVAVHADGRGRDAIWRGLEAREVYGTSGPRILLWFDLLRDDGERVPMGRSTTLRGAPEFEVRAVGSFVQEPGCPDHVHGGLSPERLEALCLGECYNPGESRHPIEAIEVVRIFPQQSAGDPIEGRIEDPWRRFECAPEAEGCVVHFRDETWSADQGDVVYYVRALQAPTPAINGAGPRVRFDAEGNAVSADICHGNYLTPDEDDCLAPVSERAWSSPIFVDAPR